MSGEIGVEVGAVNVGGGGGMTDTRWPPDDGEQQQSQVLSSGRVAGGGGGGGEGNRQSSDVVDATTHYSDDERSVAADSWSVKSEYGSTLDGEDQRTVDVVDAAAFRPLDYLYVVFLLIPSLLGSNIL